MDIEKLKLSIVEYNLIETDSLISESPYFESMVSKTYASQDSLEIYRINFDLNGELINSSGWGIAIACSHLDSLGRKIESSQYDKDGTLAETDTPPIIETVYFDSISMEQTNYRNSDRSIEGRMENTYDEQRRVIEMRWYDKNLNLESRTTYDFDDKNRTRTERSYNSSSELQISKCGRAIHVITYEEGSFAEYNFYTWVEERFYDEVMNLVDCSHNYSFDKQFSIVKREKLGNNRMKFTLLNAKNEIVESSEFEMEKN